MENFLVYDNYLCKRKHGSLKHYISLKNINENGQHRIVNTLNQFYNELSILKQPAQKKFTILIKGSPYIEQHWDVDTNDYKVNVYLLPNENQEKLVVPSPARKHHFINIFNGCELVEANKEEFYVIKCDNNRGIYIVDTNNHLVNSYAHIFEVYNVFEGKHIVVDIDSFKEAGYIRDNGLIDLQEIEKTIVKKYHISYIKKILAKNDLRGKDLKTFIEKCNCQLHNVYSDTSGQNFMYFVVDNFGDHYEMTVHFDEVNGSSKFHLEKKVKVQ